MILNVGHWAICKIKYLRPYKNTFLPHTHAYQISRKLFMYSVRVL